ncbi:MAG: hypothetical protein H7315_03915 [Herminiimonas sp.]|nr:hypothetical protein [Herminiimonas sp.]
MPRRVTPMFAMAAAWMFAACTPAEPPPDIVKTQREALNRAKAVEGVLQQSQKRTEAAAQDQR